MTVTLQTTIAHDETLFTTMPPTTLSKSYAHPTNVVHFQLPPQPYSIDMSSAQGYIHCSNREPTPTPSWYDVFLFHRRNLGCLILWWSQPTELGVGVGDRELRSRSSWWTVETVHFCMHFKSSPHPAVRRGQLCCSCRVASFFFTSRQHTYCADKTGNTHDCTMVGVVRTF